MSLISNNHDLSNQEKIVGVGLTAWGAYKSWDALDKLKKTAKYEIPGSVDNTELSKLGTTIIHEISDLNIGDYRLFKVKTVI
jgi:hypothetical protein